LVKLVLPVALHRLRFGMGLHHTTSYMLAELAGRARLYEDAEALYRDCLTRRTAEEFKIYAGLLRVLSLAQKNQKTIEVCEEGLKKAQNTNRLLFLSYMATAHMGLNHVRESLDAADEAVRTADSDNKLGCCLERVQLLSQAERHEQAIAECRALLK